jgi:hypothetical protein
VTLKAELIQLYHELQEAVGSGKTKWDNERVRSGGDRVKATNRERREPECDRRARNVCRRANLKCEKGMGERKESAVNITAFVRI